MAGLGDVVNTGLTGFDKAMGIAKAGMNSNWFNKLGQNSDMDHIQTLDEYYRKSLEREGKAFDTDKADDDKLKQYLVITVLDPNHEFSEDGQVDIIIDSTGHDVAISFLGPDGQKLELSDKIAENNEQMLEGVLISSGNMSVDDLKKFMKIDSLDKLVTEIETNDSVEYVSERDAAERVNKKNPDLGAREKDPKEKEEGEKEGELSAEEIEAKAKEMKGIPEEELSIIVKVCKENGLDPSKLKQALTFEDPNVLLQDMDNTRTDLNPYNGEVLALRFRDDGASGKDKVILIQNNQQLKYDSGNDQSLSEMMEKNKGNNITIAHNYNDGHEDEMASMVDEKLAQMQEKIKSLNEKIDRVNNFPDDKVNGKAESISSLEDQKANVMAQTHGEIVAEVSKKFPCKEAERQADSADEKVVEAAKEAEDESHNQKTTTESTEETDSMEGYHPLDPIYRKMHGDDKKI